MNDIILHHFPASPFAEKARLALGIKGLEWYSVDIPMVMPKPLLTALTGGYRKTPVMQVGADVYCDTRCIALALEQLYPEPTLFPDGSEALALALGYWSDNAFFQPGAALSMGTNAELPEDILSDRRDFFDFLDFDTLDEQLPHYFSQFASQLQLADRLVRGSDYLSGGSPGWADIQAYFPLWMARGNIAAIDNLVAELPALLAWERRMQRIGHGTPRPLAAEAALEFALGSMTTVEAGVCPGAWPQGLEVGAMVTVTPQDYGAVPVHGRLHRLGLEEVAIRREDPATGEVVVHFPRAGYRVEALTT